MDILFIRPNSPAQTLAPPMGLLYIAAAVRRVAKADIRIIDGRLDRLQGDPLEAQMAKRRPDLVGISAMTNEADGAVEAARLARRLWPDVPVILGGPWPSSAPEQALEQAGADLAVRGEGEQSVQEVVRRLGGGAPLAGIPGTVYRSGGETIAAEPGPLIEDLDSIAYPDYDALDLERYLTHWQNGQNRLQHSTRNMPLFTSRGCPFQCIFCHNLFGKRFRARSPGHVLAEIELLVGKYRVEEIEISDDIFNLDLGRAKAIIGGIIERRLPIRLSFPNGLRADRMDEELVDLLGEARCTRICYAVESASPRVQKLLGKGINLEKTRRIISYTARRGINVGGFFILGFPGETAEDMEMTVRYAVESELDTASFFYLSPFPGTRLAKEHPEAAAARFKDYSDLPVNLSAVSDGGLRRIRKRAYRRFYLKPRRILRNLKTSPKNWMLARNLWAIGRLFFKDYVRY